MNLRRILVAALALTLVLPLAASAQNTLDELLEQVRRSSQEEHRVDQERLQRFNRERNNQSNLLNQARAELRREEERSDRLQREFDENEQQLAELETTLDERMGNLGELFGVVRQAAGDMRGNLRDSMTSAQIKGRSEFFAELAEADELPRSEEHTSELQSRGHLVFRP